jgi:predicted nuclease of predicted toxin-antitoxin system
MKLLFDQNLSPRLPRLLADIYAHSLHVREVGLRDADDAVIWDYAKQHGFTIVSKDSDFQQRSLLYGSPPKFIWLRAAIAPCRQLKVC